MKEYVDFDISIEELADRLTMSGLEVEDIVNTNGSVVFSTYVTPNRPDLLSITGVARDVSALLNTEFRYPSAHVKEEGQYINTIASIINDTPANCIRYSARVIQNTKVCQSPEWMQQRLIAAGMRPINNVVDATNYVLLEMGQPLHAFDYDLLDEHKIVVRQAYKGEKLTTIDAEEHELSENMMVIADANKAVAVAGVMGGLDSEVTDKTTNILLESANFNRLSIRKTARALQMNTEASFRYERNVDPQLTIKALNRVAELIQKTGGGVAASGIIDDYPSEIKPAKVSIRKDRTNFILGFSLTENQIAEYLKKLEMDVDQSNGLLVTVPTFRPDIQYEEDLIEEVGRLHGYDKIPTTLPIGETMQGRDNLQNRFKNKVSSILISLGMQEVVTGSMVPKKENDQQIAVSNPMTDDLCRMRDNLLHSMLDVITNNNHHGIKDINIFQIGHIFIPVDDAIDEKLSIAGAITGSIWNDSWNIDKKITAVDFYTVKGILEILFDSLQIDNVTYKPHQDSLLHPGRTAIIESNGKYIGIIGETSSQTMAKYDLADRTIVFELDFNNLMEAGAYDKQSYTQLSKYPAITRDIAIVVSDEVSCEQLTDAIKSAAGDSLESLTLFDVYTGQQLPEGKKSMAFKAQFRSQTRTLRDDEVEPQIAAIKLKLSDTFKAAFR